MEHEDMVEDAIKELVDTWAKRMIGLIVFVAGAVPVGFVVYDRMIG